MPMTTPPPTRLMPQQTRVIHASEGMRLRVVGGGIWLTQPNAAQDLFLRAGDTIDLMQDWVVVGADAANGSTDPAACSAYELQPLVVPQPRISGFRGGAQGFKRLLTMVANASKPLFRNASAL